MTKDFGKPKKQFKKPHIWWVAMKPPAVGWLHARPETKTRGDGDDVKVACIGIESLRVRIERQAEMKTM